MTGHPMGVACLSQIEKLRIFFGADLRGLRATGAEPAAGWWIGRTRDVSL